ncbi:MAG TPA: AsmA-like C-terminal region-containing protein, partial [Candidatus Limnocylindrales bacterium]|nr:AsmA-like C-terminal region-containing protein [Candidatus Limnocylindrales bacterium]
YRDGTHSATQIARRLEREEGQAPPREEKISVSLQELSIEEAKFTLVLEGEDGGETQWRIDPFTIRLSGIGGARNDFEIETRIDGAVRGEIGFSGSLAREGGAAADPPTFRLDGKGKVFGQPVTVDGKISAPAGAARGNVTVAFPKIDVGSLPKIFARPPTVLSEASLKGVASLAVKVSGSLQAMGIDAELRFPPLFATARGSIVSSTGEREWSGSARIASLAEFAKVLGGGLSQWAPTGRLAVSAKGKRPASSAKEIWNAALEPVDVGFRNPSPRLDLQGLNGRVELSERKVDFQPLAGSINGQRFTLRGPVSLGAAPAGPASLRMAYLDLDALFPPGQTGKQAKKQEPGSAVEKGEEAKGISVRGDLRIDAGKARGLEFRDLAGTGRYEDGNLFLDSLKVRLYGGEATASGRIRLTGAAPEFRIKVGARDVSVEEILSRKTSLKDFLSGKANLTADLGGGTRDFAEFARTAAGSGSFRVAGGKIKGVDLLSTAAGRAGLRAALPPGASGGGRVEETSFSDLSCDFRIDGGKIRTDSLRILSDRMGITGSAALGFDRTLEFRGTLVLSKELSERVRGAAGQFLTGPSGRVEIPLRMSGPVASPAVRVDTDALARGLGGKALRDLMERIPGGAPPSGTEPGKSPPARTEPEKALEGLFE